jgi:endonuclease-3
MNRHPLDDLPKKGTYTLIIRLLAGIHLKIGKLGEHRLPKGYYTYTGSALGKSASNLRNRVARHLQKNKSKFWHVDYLLTHEKAVITTIIAGWTSKKLECKVNKCLKDKLAGKARVSNFGASDCKKKCESHLLYFGARDVRHEVASIYRENFGRKVVVMEVAKI